MNQVQKVGSRANSFVAVALYFFYPIGVRTYYFSYKGFYANTFGEVPLKYNLATVIVTPLQYSQSISVNQVGELYVHVSNNTYFPRQYFVRFLFLFFQFKAFQRLLAGGQNFLGTSPAFFRQPKTPVLCNNGIVSLTLIP